MKYSLLLVLASAIVPTSASYAQEQVATFTVTLSKEAAPLLKKEIRAADNQYTCRVNGEEAALDAQQGMEIADQLYCEKKQWSSMRDYLLRGETPSSPSITLFKDAALLSCRVYPDRIEAIVKMGAEGKVSLYGMESDYTVAFMDAQGQHIRQTYRRGAQYHTEPAGGGLLWITVPVSEYTGPIVLQ